EVKADDRKGSCHWVAAYSFSHTGRNVINKIDASFEFKEGLILRHIDRFAFWKWSRMALGTPGLLLGWSPFLQNKVRATALAGLKKFMAENATY
ncbi:MAG: nuclear transport factor 2 family protein, partial [Cyclobacteriaceae bacterium]|nr:nuclear transport factor 2 family protein [Cyclobacteriaceae bacterium]